MCLLTLNTLFFAHLHLRVKGQKALCDGHTDKVVYTISMSIQTFFI